MADSVTMIVAKAMLRRTLFADDTVSAETIWRAQQPQVRGTSLARAGEFIVDLEKAGLEIRGK